MLSAGFSDWKWRRIPNWLTMGGLFLGFVFQNSVFGGMGWTTSLYGIATALAISLPLFTIRGLGGGDVKLMASAGAMVGPHNFVHIFIINAIAGGVVALGLVIAKGKLRRTIENINAILRSLGSGQAPYRKDPRLGIESEYALTIPRGLILAGTAGLLLASGQL